MQTLTPVIALATAMAFSLPAFAQTATDPAADATAPTTAPAVKTETDSATSSPLSSDSAVTETTTTTTTSFAIPEGYSAVSDWSSVTAEQLKGATLYAVDGTNIGTIADVHLAADGKIDGVITDVGGFLGIGAHTVNLSLSDVSLYQDTDKKVVASTPLTTDALKALPEYTPA